MNGMDLPRVIQGGMGVGVSGYALARAVARAGGMGVVSGTAIDTVLVRRLQLGDPTGDMRGALAAFPFPEIAERILERYFVPGGIGDKAKFRMPSMPNFTMSAARLELIVAANFVEVFLAKQGHAGLVGVNYLEKIQAPTLPSLLGALLAHVDAIFMGAGLPTQIPGAIGKLSRWEPAELRMDVAQSSSQAPFTLRLDPAELLGGYVDGLITPPFIAIVSSHVVAKVLKRKSSGPIFGFVVEDHTAGGHNAPPRSKGKLGDRATFGPEDAPDLAAIREVGLPFWLAGGLCSPDALEQALAVGAAGVQLGTAFAYCEESGITPELKRDVIARLRAGELKVVTDMEASPTGYPFKLALRDDTELTRLRARARVCDLGYLRQAYVREDGSVGYRCPGEPVEAYVAKGGAVEATHNRLCLCNQLLSTVGLGQRRDDKTELPVLTAGQRLEEVLSFLSPDTDSYTAADVLDVLLNRRAVGVH